MIDYKTNLMNVLMARKLCPETDKVYKIRLSEYLGFCYSSGILPEDMPHEGLVEYLANGGSIGACGQRRALLVNLYEFVLSQGFKLLALPYAKKRITVPESLSPEQIQQIFNAVPNNKHRLILKIMYALGLRVSEVVKIHSKDFREKKNIRTGENYFELKLTGKGIKQRLVPIPKETMNEIICFIEDNSITEYLFAGQFKDYYSERSVQEIFMGAKIKCGIKVPGNTHLLRKSRATHFIDGNINDRNIMLMFGWDNAKTINHYHRASTSAIKEAVDNVDILIQNSMRQLNNQFHQQIKA